MKTFFTNIFSAVSENLISGGAYYLILKGILTTAVITVSAWILAVLIGGLVSYFMCYEKKVVSNIAKCVCFVLRSIPALLTLWLFSYCIFGGGHFPATLVVGIALGFWGAGHMAELLGNAVLEQQKRLSDRIRGKLEKQYYSLVLPQALQDSLYHVKRLFILLLQLSALAGYVSVNDLTQVMYGIGQRTMYPFFSIFFAAICYMLATLLVEWIFRILGKKLDELDREA